MKNRRMVLALLALAAGLLSVGLYSDALSHGFIWDDGIVVKEQLPYFTGLSAAFVPPAGIPRFSPCYYRPLVLLSYQVDRDLAGPAAAAAAGAPLARAFHRFNVAANGIAAALVLLLGAALARAAGWGAESLVPAVVGAALFAAHPVHVEAVAWIVGRADLLCGLFLAGALALHLWFRETGRLALWGGAVACALAAMLAKENGVAALVLLPLLDLALGRGTPTPAPDRVATRPPLSPIALRWGLLAAAGVAYGGLRWAGLHSLPGRCTPAGAWRLGAAPGALGWCVLKALWPASQTAYVDSLPDGVLSLVGWSVLASSVLAFALLLRRGAALQVEAHLFLAFGAVLAPSLFVAASGILDRPVAERYLYAPTVALCPLVGLLLARAARRAFPARPMLRCAAPVGLALVLVLPAGRAVVARTNVFRDDVSFWSAAVAGAPGSLLPQVQLGAALNNAGRRAEARTRLTTLWNADLDPELRAMTATQLGNLSMYESRFEDAVEFYRRSLDSKPDQPGAHFNWGLAELQLAHQAPEGAERSSRVIAAARQLAEAVRLNPGWVRARFELGRALIEAGRTDEGRRELAEVIRLAPAGAEASRARALLGGRTAPGNAAQ